MLDAKSSLISAVSSLLAVMFSMTMAVESTELRLDHSQRPTGTSEAAEPVPDDTIQLFKDGHFKDDFIAVNGVSASNKPGESRDLPKDMKDSLSSLRWNLPSGVLVVLYEDSNAEGEQLALWGKGQIDGLDKFDLNDKASQWGWFYVGGADVPPSQAGGKASTGPIGAEVNATTMPEGTIQLFKDKNFKGTSATVTPSTAEKNSEVQRLPKDLPDSLTSLRWNLPPGVVVVFHQDADGSKQQFAIWGNGQMADLDKWDINDKASRWTWHHIGSPVKVTGEAPAR